LVTAAFRPADKPIASEALQSLLKILKHGEKRLGRWPKGQLYLSGLDAGLKAGST